MPWNALAQKYNKGVIAYEGDYFGSAPLPGDLLKMSSTSNITSANCNIGNFATATIVVSGGTVTTLTVDSGTGLRYAVGDVVTADASIIGTVTNFTANPLDHTSLTTTTSQTFANGMQITGAASKGIRSNLWITPPGSGTSWTVGPSSQVQGPITGAMQARSYGFTGTVTTIGAGGSVTGATKTTGGSNYVDGTYNSVPLLNASCLSTELVNLIEGFKRSDFFRRLVQDQFTMFRSVTGGVMGVWADIGGTGTPQSIYPNRESTNQQPIVPYQSFNGFANSSAAPSVNP